MDLIAIKVLANKLSHDGNSTEFLGLVKEKKFSEAFDLLIKNGLKEIIVNSDPAPAPNFLERIASALPECNFCGTLNGRMVSCCTCGESTCSEHVSEDEGKCHYCAGELEIKINQDKCRKCGEEKEVHLDGVCPPCHEEGD